MLLPSVGTAVATLLDGRWLEGTVIEASIAAGEFLVEFDDDDEVQAWCSAGQPWRRLGISVEPEAEGQGGIETDGINSTPSLQPPPPPSQLPPPLPPQAPPLLPPLQPPTEENRIVFEEFLQLLNESIKSDGFGNEASLGTRERFERLYASVSVGDSPAVPESAS